MKQRYRSKQSLVTLIILCLLSGVLVTVSIYRSWQDKEKSHFSEYQMILETGFHASVQMFHLAMESFFYNSLNTPKVHEIISNSVNTSTKEANRLRGELYRILYPVYMRMRNANLMKLHLYTADGKSFLCFQQPERYGDYLLETRPVIKKSIELQQVVHGFESGRSRAAFSYAFPLNKEGKYLGGVEVAVSAQSIIESLMELSPEHEYIFVLDKEKTESHLFPQERWLYQESMIHPDYLQIRGSKMLLNPPKPLSPDIKTINTRLRLDDKVREQMNKETAFVLNKKAVTAHYTICFLPITDVLGQFTGYLISYSKDSYPLKNAREHLIWYLLSLSVLASFFFLILKLRMQSIFLLQEEEDLVTISNALAEGVCVLNTEGVIQRVNPAVIELLGYEKEELVGQSAHHFFDYGDEEKGPAKTCRICQAIMTGGEYDGEELLGTKDGRVIHVEVSCRCIYRYDSPVGGVVAFHDVTNRKKMEQQLRESDQVQRTLMESMPVAMVIIDEQSKIIEHVNPAAEAVLQLSAHQVVGHICHRFICPAETNNCPITDLKQVVDSSDRVVLRMGNVPVPVMKTVRRVMIKGKSKMLECFIDISIRKQAEEAMLQANQAKSDFLANMTHEIRTPMNAILGFIHLTLRTSLTDQQRDYLNKSHRAAKSLLSILNDILDFSKVEAGKMELEYVDFDLHDILDNVLNITEMKVYNTAIELTVGAHQDVPRQLRGDPLRLEQVLINLMGNAAKFTESGQISLWVRATGEGPDQRHLTFAVQDTGVGINPKKMNDLFVPFVQADASITRRYGGTGLGLSISSRLIQLMGGDLEAESEVGVGSTFSFTIPLELGEVQTVPVHLQGKRVLIVEPQTNSRAVLRENIAFLGGQPIAVHNGSMAAEHLATGRFDLLIAAEEVFDIQRRDFGQHFKGLTITIASKKGNQADMASVGEQNVVLRRPIGFSSLVHALQVLLDGLVSKPEIKSKVTFGPADILVVEDNLVNQQVARALLEEIGLSVSVANNGQEALDILEKRTFDLVFMDVQMPVLDGFTTIQHIRSQPQWQELTIVAMTAYATHKERNQMLLAGMNDHLAKPIEVDELVTVLKKWIPMESGRGEVDTPPVKTVEPQSVLNVEEALPRFAHRQAFFEQAIQAALEEYGDCAEILADLLGKEKYSEARILVHTMRGMMGNIGAERIYSICTALEEHISTETTASLAPLVGELADAMEQLAHHVKALGENKKEKTVQQVVHSGELLVAMDGLLESLRGRRPLDCKKQMDQLFFIETTTTHSPKMKELSSLIDEYEFDKALDIATELYEETTQRS